jgi:hypothetical protein
MLELAANLNLEVEQLEVKMTFLRVLKSRAKKSLLVD